MKRKIIVLLMFCVLACSCSQDTKTASVETSQTSENSIENLVEDNTSAEEPKESILENTSTEAKEETVTETTTETVVEESGETMYADLTTGCPGTFIKSGEWSNGSMFNVTWRKKNVTFEDGKMQLIIDNDPKGGSIPYSGGELRSKDFYRFGRYEVSMKAIKNDGVVSSFFTYTGPSDKKPWDEIDIEILGKDTTQVQFNYFTNGKGNHEKLYDLGFDASEDFHTYAFEWRQDRIDWFVDGELVYTATASIPTNEGRIMMNAWCGTGVDSWLNAFDNSNLPLIAEYQWVSYTPFAE